MGGKVLETYASKAVAEATKKTASNIALWLINRGDTDEEIAEGTQLSIEEVRELRKQSN